MRLPWQRRSPRQPVGQVITIDDQRLGVVDFGTELSRDLRFHIGESILTYGEPFRSGGVLGTACLPILGAGSTVASSLLAGNVFMATANPGTLMTIGSGVGSAIMGPGGIVGQAPFVAASGAIVPVVAPVMLFMVVSTMMMSTRFDQIQDSLDLLGTAIKQLLQREIAEDYGILLSAKERLEDISAEFSGSRRFTEAMKIRLALVENEINMLQHKYDVILRRGDVGAVVDVSLTPTDMNLFLYSSLMNIQIDGLRLKLDLQDNPDDVGRSYLMLNSKINRYEKVFTGILENDSVKKYRNELKQSIDGMNWLQRCWDFGKKRRKMVDEMQSIDKIREDGLDKARRDVAKWAGKISSMTDTGPEYSAIFYRDHDGQGELKAYYTRDLQLQGPSEDRVVTG